MNRIKAITLINTQLEWMCSAKPEWLESVTHETLGIIRMAHLLDLITDEEMSDYRKKVFDIQYEN